MSGEQNLSLLIKSMMPLLHDGEFVFCQLEPGSTINLEEVVGTFREDEGLTVIVPREYADKQGWPYQFVAAWITLTVHSALDAVGLTAAFASALADEGLSCNVVAGHHHDHIFVKWEDASKAMQALKRLASSR